MPHLYAPPDGRGTYIIRSRVNFTEDGLSGMEEHVSKLFGVTATYDIVMNIFLDFAFMRINTFTVNSYYVYESAVNDCDPSYWSVDYISCRHRRVLIVIISTYQ